jgi:uncharacterized membrane protein YqjE
MQRTDSRTLPGGGRGEVYGHEVVRDTNPDAAPDGRAEARDRSIGSLLKELRDELTTLFRQEIALAKTEMSEKAANTGRDVGSIAAGAVFLLAGLLVCLLGLSALLYWALVSLDVPNYHAGWIAPLVVGIVTALIGWVLVRSGMARIKQRSFVPEKTVQSLKEDKQWLTNQTTTR